MVTFEKLVSTGRKAENPEQFVHRLFEWRSKIMGGSEIWEYIMTGKATKESIGIYAREGYPAALGNPRWIAAMSSFIEDSKDRNFFLRMSENYGRETGLIETPNHVELLLDFAEECGLKRDDVVNAIPHAATIGMIYTMDWFCRRSVEEAIGAFPMAMEGFGKLQTEQHRHGAFMKEMYGFTDKGTKFWAVHEEVERRDAEAGESFVLQYAQSGEQQARLERAFKYSTLVIKQRNVAIAQLMKETDARLVGARR